MRDVPCVLAIATCSTDCSILTTDVETRSPKHRLENAHWWVLYIFCIMLCATSLVLLRCMCALLYIMWQ
jgi:hypothetical protein